VYAEGADFREGDGQCKSIQIFRSVERKSRKGRERGANAEPNGRNGREIGLIFDSLWCADCSSSFSHGMGTADRIYDMEVMDETGAND
jgi:hypothetical protein